MGILERKRIRQDEIRLEWGIWGYQTGIRRLEPRGWGTSGQWGGKARLTPCLLPAQVCKEKHRFERLMDYFRNEDSSIDFMVGHPVLGEGLWDKRGCWGGLLVTPALPAGRLHAVHQHCGALGGGHELSRPSPV